MPAALLVTMVGALIPTFVLSRFVRWILARRGYQQLAPAHAIAYSLSVLLYAFGAANGGSPRFLEGALVYALPQLVWFVADTYRASRRVPAV